VAGMSVKMMSYHGLCVGSERGRNLIEGAISGISVPMTVVQDKLGGAKFQQHKRCSS
jgi:hypothetical protein